MNIACGLPILAIVRSSSELATVVREWSVGAHIGFHTVHLARNCKFVVALEPEPSNFMLLKRNIKLAGLNNVKVLPIAASNFNGYADLYISSRSSGAHSLEPRNIEADAIRKVPVYRLDTLVRRLRLNEVDIIKIDVEGHEDKVVEGMSGMLRRNQPKVLVVEVSRHNIFLIDYLGKFFKKRLVLDGWDNVSINYAFIR